MTSPWARVVCASLGLPAWRARLENFSHEFMFSCGVRARDWTASTCFRRRVAKTRVQRFCTHAHAHMRTHMHIHQLCTRTPHTRIYTSMHTHPRHTHMCKQGVAWRPPPPGSSCKMQENSQMQENLGWLEKICWLTPPSRPHSGLARAGSNWDRKSKLQKCQL